MFRTRFFNKFLKYKYENSNEIVIYDSNKKLDLQKQLINEIRIRTAEIRVKIPVNSINLFWVKSLIFIIKLLNFNLFF